MTKSTPLVPVLRPCGAKTRAGTPCKLWSHTKDKRRCWLHGGKSTGPRTPEGLARSIRANWKNGEASVERKQAAKLLASALSGDGDLSPESMEIVEMLLDKEGAKRLSWKQIIQLSERLGKAVEAEE